MADAREEATLLEPAEVASAYRSILHREPENDSVVALHAARQESAESLRAELRASPEYRAIVAALSPEKRVVFLHLQKTAGTTLRTSLSRCFPPETICPEPFDRLDRYTATQLAAYRLFAAHVPFSYLWRIPGQFDVITMLREPRERLLSFYYFVHSHRYSFVEANLQNVMHIKRMSLDGFLDSGGRPLLRMVDYLADGDVALACQRIGEMAAVGLSTQFELSREIISHRLGIELPVVPAENVTASKIGGPSYEDQPAQPVPLTARQQAQLDDLTREDQVLWQAGVGRFTRDVAAYRAQAPQLVAGWRRMTRGLAGWQRRQRP